MGSLDKKMSVEGLNYFGKGKLPPGQTGTDKFPVLTYGDVPNISTGDWRFKVWGLVEKERLWTWDEFMQFPQTTIRADFHCVTHWSRFDDDWTGVLFKDLIDHIGVQREAKYVLQHAYGGYTTNLPLDVMLKEDVLFAHTFNGKPLPKNQDLPSLVADTSPGQKVTLNILRDKAERTMTVRIGEPPEEREVVSQADGRDAELGLRVQKVTPELARRHGFSNTKGVIVTEIQPGGPADQAGIEVGDVIREVNQRPVNTAKDFEQSARQSKRGDRVVLLVQRGDNTVFLALKRKS